MPPPRWYALTTKPRAEKAVARYLRSKGLDELAPAIPTRRRWSDRVKEVDQQLFPGYVFCQFTYEQRMSVLTTPGVTSVVGFGNQPTPVDDSEITAIRNILNSGARAWPWPYLRAGQRIRIENGCLQGLSGTLVRENDFYRVVVNVEILQRAVAVEIDRDMIRAIEAA